MFSFAEITLYQISLAQVFMCAAVTWIERNRLPVMHERWLQLAQTAVCIPNIILDIGILRVAQCRELERCNGPVPVAGAQGLLASREIRVERRPVRIVHDRPHCRADRPVLRR